MNIGASQNKHNGFQIKRQELVQLLESKGIHDKEVLRAIAAVPRHCFVSPEFERLAYKDSALPLDEYQSVSQPYIVAYMTEAISAGREVDKLLEVGTGSGYQAAVASQVAARVFTIECRENLFERARKILRELDYANIHIKRADGSKGWAQFAPYDAIIMTAACDEIPETLLKQLAVGGSLIAPVGYADEVQQLTLVTRTTTSYRRRHLLDVRFVPMFQKGKVSS